MSIVTQSKQSLFGGVNEQSAEHRMDNQVQEMINCIPTLNLGLLKRNPTTGIDTYRVDKVPSVDWDNNNNQVDETSIDDWTVETNLNNEVTDGIFKFSWDCANTSDVTSLTASLPITTVDGSDYRLSFEGYERPWVNQKTEVFIDGSSVGEVKGEQEYIFTATSGTNKIDFVNTTSTDSGDYYAPIADSYAYVLYEYIYSPIGASWHAITVSGVSEDVKVDYNLFSDHIIDPQVGSYTTVSYIVDSITYYHNAKIEEMVVNPDGTKLAKLAIEFKASDGDTSSWNRARAVYLSSLAVVGKTTVYGNVVDTINFTDKMWTYEYDRGLAGNSSERYIMYISDNGLEILNVDSGQIYKKGSGITFGTYPENGDSTELYLAPMISRNGFAAITVKDTTFISNKNIAPKLKGLDEGVDDNVYPYVLIPLIAEPAGRWNRIGGRVESRGNILNAANAYQSQRNHAPYHGTAMYSHEDDHRCCYKDHVDLEYQMNGVNMLIKIDGVEIDISTSNRSRWHDSDKEGGGHADKLDSYNVGTMGQESLDSFYTRIESQVAEALELKYPNTYIVRRGDIIGDPVTGFPSIRVLKLINGSEMTYEDVTFSSSKTTLYKREDHYDYIEIVPKASNYFLPMSDHKWTTDLHPREVVVPEHCFIWVKTARTTTGYTYSYSITTNLFPTPLTGVVTDATDTNAAAAALRSSINAHEDGSHNPIFSASLPNEDTANSSIVKVSAAQDTDFITTLETSDTYGDMAMSSWVNEVSSINDLPMNLGYEGEIVKITGDMDIAVSAYWVKYTGTSWKETYDPTMFNEFDISTMPHTINRDEDGNFLFDYYSEYANRVVGDMVTNKNLSIIGSPIKDLFFMKNRLALVTKNSVVMSEVGEYGNFWRTTVMTLLDSDPIDATVDSIKAINIEYATYLEDAVMLFSDKAQFSLRGGDILSPKSVQITQTSAYEINRNVRPLFMNDKVFFVAKRGDKSAVMEYSVTGGQVDTRSVVDDTTAHVQNYIDDEIISIKGSPQHDMIFIQSGLSRNTMYVYKYYEQGNEKVQKAWFKWTFKGLLYNVSLFGSDLFTSIARQDKESYVDWILGDSTWWMDKTWAMDGVWHMEEQSVPTVDLVETMTLQPQSYNMEFVDNNDETYASLVELGEWVYSSANSQIRTTEGVLQFRTVQILAEEDSSFDVVIDNVRRGSSRIVPSKYTERRRLLVGGNAKDGRISISSDTSEGFRINQVSFEGTLTTRRGK